MAIDDNTSYELTGYQVKDLAGRIRLKADASAIPTVNDATLTITQNGTSAGTFTANSSTNTTIALTDTTYSAFTGTDGQTAGTAGLVPAPATTDAGKFLKADGTWDAAGGGTLYSTTGQNTDGAMTQKATTDMIFVPGYSPEYSTIDSRIRIGYNASSASSDGIALGRGTGVTQSGSSGIAIGQGAQVETTQGVAIGTSAHTTYNGNQSVAIGGSSLADGLYSVALGFGSHTGVQDYVVSVGHKAVNDELYRRIINVADATAAHDAVTKGQLDTVAGTIPTVNDGTLTIQHNGTNKGTFTANQSTASTVNIETIYADTPGTATTPAASVQASDIDWSTMPGSYSTTEQKTPFTWIDDKPIYKKTYSMGALINGGGTLTQNVSSLNFETVVELRGIAISPTTKNVRPLPLVANELSDMVRIDVSNNAIRVITTTGSSWSTVYNAYVTIWYTKTTD